jgi:hypothetical protein
MISGEDHQDLVLEEKEATSGEVDASLDVTTCFSTLNQVACFFWLRWLGNIVVTLWKE